MNAVESATPSLVDVAMRGLPQILPILDFSTIKNELFPVIATVFSRTNSLAIKVRGLQAFVVLCGGSNDPDAAGDGLDGFGTEKKKSSSSSALDKYTMQEKIIPLIKAIKTKEPAVMMAALNVLRVVGDYADIEFAAMDMLPILWHMSLGPLLDLKQFQSFMTLIKSLSKKVEEEQTKKLQELSNVSGTTTTAAPNEDFMGFGGLTGTQFDATNGSAEDDFERLVKGKSSNAQPSNPMDSSWETATPAPAAAAPTAPSPPVTSPQFSWSTPSPTASKPQPSFRTVTPDLNQISTLTPSATQFSQPLQPAANANPWASSSSSSAAPMSPPPPPASSFGSMNLGQTQRPAINPTMSSSFTMGGQPSSGRNTPSSFSLPPPPGASQQPQNSMSAFGQASSAFGSMPHQSTGSMGGMMGGMNSMNSSMNTMTPTNNNTMGMMGSMNNNMMMNNGIGSMQPPQPQQPPPQQQPRSGLAKYESLL